MCCPTLKVTATGPAETSQNQRLGLYEFYKFGADGNEIFKKILGKSDYYIFFNQKYRWMVRNITSLSSNKMKNYRMIHSF